MIYQIFAIAVKELKILCKDWEALALLFAMPMFFIVVMSFALEGVYGAGGKNHPIKLLVVNQDPGPQAKEAITDLRQLEGLTLIEEDKGLPLNIDKAEQLIRTRKYPLALVFREDFSDRIVQGTKASDEKRASVSLMVDPAMNQQMVAPLQGAIKGLLERRALLAQLPQRIKEASSRLPGSFFDLHPLAQEIQKQFEKRFSARDVMDKETEGVVFEIISPIGLESGRWPTVIEQNVPACAIFGVFFIVLTLASSFIQERKDGTFQRILTSPLSKGTLFIGKLVPYYLLNLIQIALMFLVGVVIFGMNLGNLPALVLVSMALSLSANGLGLLVAAFGKTEAQVNSLAVLLAITLGALGGMMVPTFIMPEYLKTLSLFTPHAWALAGYHDIIIRGLGTKDILNEMFVLLGFASIFFVIALWRFRFDK